MTATWQFTFTCTACGGTTSLAASGVASLWHTSAIVVCDRCGSRWQLVVLAEQIAGPPAPSVPLPCGTDRAYRRHYERGEKPCAACRVAHSLTRKKRGE